MSSFSLFASKGESVGRGGASTACERSVAYRCEREHMSRLTWKELHSPCFERPWVEAPPGEARPRCFAVWARKRAFRSYIHGTRG